MFIKTLKQLTILGILAFAVPLAPGEAKAQSKERSGKEVAEAVCYACHATGKDGAPKIGDEKAWSKRISQGLTGLTSHALQGIRKMPPHGGNPGLSDLEISRAITHMVNQSGGHWIEPVSKTNPPAERNGEQVVQAQCVKCHKTGEGGAPKIGDRAAWIPRLKQGLDAVVRSAIRGHGGMPARGGMANLTDSEMREAVSYMFNQGTAPAKGPAAAPVAVADPNHKVIQGTEIYLGIVSAESIREQHQKGDPESSMHGGIPTRKGYYHVNISLLDSKTKAPISDAQVEVRVADPVMGGETKKLDLMAFNNAISYGNYFRMQGKDPYTITVKIRRPGTSRVIEAKFDYKHY